MSDSPPIMNSPSPALLLERSVFWGELFKGALWGIQLFMFFYSVSMAWNAKTASSRKKNRSYILVGAVLLSCLTIALFVNGVFLEYMWIDHRDAPGGPLGYLGANSSIWWQTLGTAATQLGEFLGDGLLIYRCFIIWNRRWSVLVVPILFYLGAIAMGIMTMVQSAVPGSNFFRGKTVDFGVPWASLSVALNVTITALIAYRILRARSMIRRLQESNESLEVYVSVAAILIESALPFSVLGIIFAVTYGKNLPQAPGFLFAWASFATLSPQFIIFRVITGRAWTHDVAADLDSTSVNTLAFSPPGTKKESSFHMNTIRSHADSSVNNDFIPTNKSAGSLT
ncbi:hypothetical protein C8J57DRAFT_1302225 [Mycena rebaudengoi]|nr:hypothetical protein C8J57DRAFT_1302225 [Mycena rebaudengoi]